MYETLLQHSTVASLFAAVCAEQNNSVLLGAVVPVQFDEGGRLLVVQAAVLECTIQLSKQHPIHVCLSSM